MSENKQKLGMAICILGGLVAIGITIFVTGNAAYLWALVLLMWGVTRVRASKKNPLYVGALMALLYVALGVVIYFVKDGAYLWAMVLIMWLAGQIL
ncbi:hypothetical protein A3A84_01900 [Candidatus Collierbacteria bacterium RIFCSPLOWO2_01_FULL_50_23]|uniref:Uncharacterized protein n=1 Tax=Candidatus Collierbacteria bacterium RIFCSPHIGHO2_02_FULL_49_10 TaxID=1817723 RepID=A0A1F5ERF9_9BACT|nr:MAG: hypothetical protein A3D09_03615 [Candidatus Collierbacteria bacterium RIFCSPHIGHO2_02_FULL_49_10]OGD74148.1 MAG: hypothetical protein A3A84_01900 [Candidatus Collierbacteria bacterium RIFCSPLOWO2_01_FULL_50_23]